MSVIKDEKTAAEFRMARSHRIAIKTAPMSDDHLKALKASCDEHGVDYENVLEWLEVLGWGGKLEYQNSISKNAQDIKHCNNGSEIQPS